MFLGQSATVLALSVRALLAASVGAADQPEVADKSPQGGTVAAGEVRKVVDTFAECWNRHDMNAFAEVFAPDAEFVNVVGLWWKGKDEIKRAHERTHATMFKNSRLTITEVSVRFLWRVWPLLGLVGFSRGMFPPRARPFLHAAASFSPSLRAVLGPG